MRGAAQPSRRDAPLVGIEALATRTVAERDHVAGGRRTATQPDRSRAHPGEVRNARTAVPGLQCSACCPALGVTVARASRAPRSRSAAGGPAPMAPRGRAPRSRGASPAAAGSDRSPVARVARPSGRAAPALAAPTEAAATRSPLRSGHAGAIAAGCRTTAPSSPAAGMACRTASRRRCPGATLSAPPGGAAPAGSRIASTGHQVDGQHAGESREVLRPDRMNRISSYGLAHEWLPSPLVPLSPGTFQANRPAVADHAVPGPPGH